MKNKLFIILVLLILIGGDVLLMVKTSSDWNATDDINVRDNIEVGQLFLLIILVPMGVGLYCTVEEWFNENQKE